MGLIGFAAHICCGKLGMFAAIDGPKSPEGRKVENLNFTKLQSHIFHFMTKKIGQ